MRDIKALQLATKKYAVENVYLSWWYVLSTLAIFAGLLTVACLDLPLILRISASILAGLVTTRFFVIYHDYQHKAILQGSWLAKVIFSVFGMVALNPANIWNRSHNHHHKNNSKSFGASIGSYPLMTTDAYAHAKGWERFRYGLARHPATIALGYLTIFFYGMCLRSLMTNPRRHIDSALSLLLHFTIIAFLAVFAWDIMLLGVIVPSAVAAAVGAYLFYAQHNFPEVKIRERGFKDAETSLEILRNNLVLHRRADNNLAVFTAKNYARSALRRLPENMQDPIRKAVQRVRVGMFEEMAAAKD